MLFNILVVDDSATARAFMIKMLKVARIPVAQLLQAANGLAAIEVLCSNPIDLVFADIHMPLMDGVELIERMKQSPQLDKIPVVVVTSEGNCHRIELIRAAGVAAYVRKPADPGLLRDVVHRALNIQTGSNNAV